MEKRYTDNIMTKGITKFKNLSELPDDVREKIYSLRLYYDIDKSIDEYMEVFDNIVVDNYMYHSDTLYAKNVAIEYKQAEEKHRGYYAMLLPMVVIKEGVVLKNRFGKTENPKIKAHNDMVEERFPLTDDEMEEFLENIKDEDIPPLPDKYKTIDWLETEENIE